MADAWNVARSTRTCALSGNEIPPETPYYSALIDTDAGLERRDYTAESWPEVETGAFFSYWKNKGYSPHQSKRPPVDWERVLAVFDRLADATDKEKQLLRYVLALILVRRRRLRLDDMGQTDGCDRLVLWDRRDGGRVVEVTSPAATKEELDETQARLNDLFDADIEAE